MKRSDLLVIGVPRSGTSMLASVLHSPEKQWIFYEAQTWLRLKDVDAFTACPKWGSKQINVRDIKQFSSTHRPRQILAITRHVRDCGMSYAIRAEDHFQNECHQVIQNEVMRRCWMVSSMCRYLTEAKEQGGIRVSKEEILPVTLWVKYEDLVSRPEETKERIREATGWECLGSPDHFLVNIPHVLSRVEEAKQHHKQISKVSLDKYKDVHIPPIIQSLMKGCQRYTDTFYPGE